MGSIFISYSHKDTDYAHKLANTLQSIGLDVWIDERLDYGSQWPTEIQKQLDACSAFIVIMGPRSFASEWVQSELQRAKRKLKSVFPLLLEGDEPWLSVESTQYYDVRKGILPDDKFFSAIQRVVSSEPGVVAVPASEAKKYPGAKKPKLKTVYLLAIVGVIVAISVVFLPSLFGANPSEELPISSEQPPDSSLPPETTAVTDMTAGTTEPELQPVSATQTDDVYDENGIVMRFVPAGEFEMGSSESSYGEERPAHTVYLDEFYIDKYEVTNVSYKSCVDAGVCQQPNELSSATRPDYYGNPEFDDYPVIYVDWDMAVTYCEEWRGAALPTEAQWEKAARGTNGRSYPWGEGIDATFANYNDSVGDTTLVGAYEDGQSPYGVYDMSGNVWEWVTDWYDENYYGNLGELTENPAGPASGEFHGLRGGSWLNEEDFVRTFTRGWNDLSYFDYADFGFRCVRDTTP